MHCASAEINKQGRDPTQPERQKYRCKDCGRWFDDLSETILAGHHQPLRTWVLCLYFMGLNLSNRQIGQELGLHKDDAQRMTQQLREGIESKQFLARARRRGRGRRGVRGRRSQREPRGGKKKRAKAVGAD